MSMSPLSGLGHSTSSMQLERDTPMVAYSWSGGRLTHCLYTKLQHRMDHSQSLTSYPTIAFALVYVCV